MKSCRLSAGFFFALPPSWFVILQMMVNTDDLWMGDPLETRDKKVSGVYDGMHQGKVRLKTAQGSVLLLLPQELILREEPEEEEEELTFDEAPSMDPAVRFNLLDFPSSLDLHIAQLSPAHVHAPAQRILSLQLEALSLYLDAAEQTSTKIVTIIHGKGTGVLKAETYHHLKGRASVKFMVEAHQGGAVEVWLK